MKKLLPLFALTIGCANPQHVIKIDSEPPGARVFFGSGPNEQSAEKSRSYLGKTPLEWTMTSDTGNYFMVSGAPVYSSFVPPAAVFFCDPPTGSTNLYPQKQVFHRPTPFTAGDKVPQGVFFDLTKPAIVPSGTNQPVKK